MNLNSSFNESQKIQEAIVFLQTGKLDLAQKTLEVIISQNSNNAEALHFLGLVFLQKKDFGRAYDLISESIKLAPKNGMFYTNRGEVAREMGKLDDALRDHCTAISLDSSNSNFYFNRAVVYHQKHLWEQAKEDYSKVIELDKKNHLVYFCLGNLYAEIENFDKACECFKKSIEINPSYNLAWANLGHVNEKLKNIEEAVRCYERSILIYPLNSIAHSNLGNALVYSKRYDDAIRACETAINLDPNFAPAYANLADALSAKKKYREAVAYYKKALDLDPRFIQAYFNCSNAYLELNELKLAVECLDIAAKLDSAKVDIYYNRGNIKCKYDIAQGLLDFEEVVRREPNTEIVLGNLLLGYLRTCEWLKYNKIKKLVVEKLGQNLAIANPLQLVPAFDSLAYLKKAAALYTEKYFSCKQIGKKLSHQKRDKIKIGYLSEDFKKHPVSYLLLEVLVNHDRKHFEIHALSLSRNKPDQYTEDVIKSVDAFHDLGWQTDENIVEFINSQSYDIVIDLGVFTSMRLSIFKERVAPVQVNFLGYAGTSGAVFMDYIIADDFTVPADSDNFYTEKVVRLPSFMPRDTRVKSNLKPYVRADFNLPENSFIFVCTSGYGKITPEVFESWMNILKKVPDSYLWLGESKDVGVTNKIKEHASSLGVNPERLLFFKFLDSPTDYLSRLQLADLFLDTFPYGAHTTANDALWAGVPVLTHQGETFASRVAGSFLNSMGLSDLITESFKAYEDKAVQLAQNPKLLKQINEQLIKNKSQNILFDMVLYTSNLEKAFKLMYDLSLAGKSPENILIKKDE